jgi:hypothetical protein
VRRYAHDSRKIRDALSDFLDGEVFAAMRPADRVELKRFEMSISAPALATAVKACEGLDKFLETLGAINQCDVLVRHDQKLIKETRSREKELSPKKIAQLGRKLRGQFQ